MRKKATKSNLLAIAIIGLTLVTVSIYPKVKGVLSSPAGDPIAPHRPALLQPAQQNLVEVVFVVDTTGSMGGLLHAAKENIWSIASTMANARGNTSIRMGLVAFRDRGDRYVTRVTDLSADLDSIYATLMDYQAQGGGDEPESVGLALEAAVEQMSWSGDPTAYQTVFLVGDAPAHDEFWQSRQQQSIFAEAGRKGIAINTIQCGHSAPTRRQWEQIAQLGNGEYLQVGQDGGALAVATPFDHQLADLGRALDDTRLFFGDSKARIATDKKTEASRKFDASASIAARAKRAIFNLGSNAASSYAGEHELLEALEQEQLSLIDIPDQHLPSVMQSMSPRERESFVAGQSTRRNEILDQIRSLKRQRKEYIVAEVAKGIDKKVSLEHQIFETVRRQAATKGLHYEQDIEY